MQSADGSEVGRGRGAGDWKWLLLCTHCTLRVQSRSVPSTYLPFDLSAVTSRSYVSDVNAMDNKQRTNIINNVAPAACELEMRLDNDDLDHCRSERRLLCPSRDVLEPLLQVGRDREAAPGDAVCRVDVG